MLSSIKNALFPSLGLAILLLVTATPSANSKGPNMPRATPERWIHGFIAQTLRARTFDEIAPYFISTERNRMKGWTKNAKLKKLNHTRRWARTVKRIGKATIAGYSAEVPLTSVLVTRADLCVEGDKWKFSNIAYKRGTTHLQRFGK